MSGSISLRRYFRSFYICLFMHLALCFLLSYVIWVIVCVLISFSWFTSRPNYLSVFVMCLIVSSALLVYLSHHPFPFCTCSFHFLKQVNICYTCFASSCSNSFFEIRTLWLLAVYNWLLCMTCSLLQVCGICFEVFRFWSKGNGHQFCKWNCITAKALNSL